MHNHKTRVKVELIVTVDGFYCAVCMCVCIIVHVRVSVRIRVEVIVTLGAPPASPFA